MRRKRIKNKEAELNITSFMNLMIVLVPVLLLNMVFSHITVLDLKLPDLAAKSKEEEKKKLEDETLELVINNDGFVVNFPAGKPLRRIPKNDDSKDYDFKALSDILQEVKRLLANKGVEKKDILILSQPRTSYQTIVSAMDTARSYKTVQAASVVDAELFPNISLGDAPDNTGAGES